MHSRPRLKHCVSRPTFDGPSLKGQWCYKYLWHGVLRRWDENKSTAIVSALAVERSDHLLKTCWIYVIQRAAYLGDLVKGEREVVVGVNGSIRTANNNGCAENFIELHNWKTTILQVVWSRGDLEKSFWSSAHCETMGSPGLVPKT